MNALAKTECFYRDGLASSYNEVPTYEQSQGHDENMLETLPSYQEQGADYPPILKKLRVFPSSPVEFPRSFRLLQGWEGLVTQVLDNSFMAIITDKTNSDNDQEEVELDLGEIPDEDLRFVRAGALFYWSVGYEDGLGIPRQRVSRIRFKRLPGLTMREIARAKATADTLSSLFE